MKFIRIRNQINELKDAIKEGETKLVVLQDEKLEIMEQIEKVKLNIKDVEIALPRFKLDKKNQSLLKGYKNDFLYILDDLKSLLLKSDSLIEEMENNIDLCRSAAWNLKCEIVRKLNKGKKIKVF